MSVQLCLALLALSSLAAASDPSCDELVKPVEDRTKVYGKWIYHVGASDSEEQMKVVQYSASSLVEISPLPGSDDLTMRYGDRINGKCHYGTATSSTSGNSTKWTLYFNSTTYEHFGSFLVTCPDCVLWLSEVVSEVNGEAKRSKSLFLCTKTEKLDPSHLEEFRKQAKCLNMLSDFYFPETTNLCPDEQEAAAED